jgi:hypothetical protein
MVSHADPSRRNDSFASGFKPGHLVWMPAGSTWLNNDKPRPFALARRCSPHELATLVYGSTQATERIAGAACVEVAPVREGLHRNGLRARTYFYPSTLLPLPHEHLPPASGYLGQSLDALRQALRVALGIGTGSCRTNNAVRGSCRGRIVVLSSALAADINAAAAVVLTEPRYSAQRNYQIILPIFTASARNAGAHDLVVSRPDWAQAPDPGNRVLLAIPATHSVWHADDIARETEYVVDDDMLAQIDRRLCDYFSLTDDADG